MTYKSPRGKTTRSYYDNVRDYVHYVYSGIVRLGDGGCKKEKERRFEKV